MIPTGKKKGPCKREAKGDGDREKSLRQPKQVPSLWHGMATGQGMLADITLEEARTQVPSSWWPQDEVKNLQMLRLPSSDTHEDFQLRRQLDGLLF